MSPLIPLAILKCFLRRCKVNTRVDSQIECVPMHERERYLPYFKFCHLFLVLHIYMYIMNT